MPDAEIDAMAKVADALGGLEEDERGRVLRWAAERYGVVIGKPPEKVGGDDDGDDLDGGDEGKSGGTAKTYEHFAELYDVAGAKTDSERVLVASYWTQVIKGKTTFGSQELNKLLKDLGHGVGTINKAMSTNIEKKPALILQVSRSGSAQQARKKYKLTDAGLKWVAARVA